MKLYLKIILIFSIALNIGVLAAIGYNIKHSPFRKAEMEVNKRLELTPEQKKIMDKSKMQIGKSVIASHIKLNQHRKIVLELFRAESPDKKAILMELKKVNEIRDEMSRNMIDHLLLMHKTLTPEQREKFLKMTEKAIFQEGMGPMQGDRFMRRDEEHWRQNQEKRKKMFGDFRDEGDGPPESEGGLPPDRMGKEPPDGFQGNERPDFKGDIPPDGFRKGRHERFRGNAPDDEAQEDSKPELKTESSAKDKHPDDSSAKSESETIKPSADNTKTELKEQTPSAKK